MLLNIFLVFIGIIILAYGSDIAIENAKELAKKMNVSELFVGLTVASIGSSLPEILTGVMSGVQILLNPGNPEYHIYSSGIAVGNIVGSDIGQITILLGIVALFGTLKTTKESLKRDGFMLIFSIILMALVCLDLKITQLEGVFLIICYLIYLYVLIRKEDFKNLHKVRKREILRLISITIIGIFAVVGASYMVVDNSIQIAQILGVSTYIIGLLLGLGTSLPELVISLQAILKNSHSISIGNLIGSNITDPLLSLGAGASVVGFSVMKSTLFFDIPYWALSTLFVLIILSRKLEIRKHVAFILIGMYFLFMALKIFVPALA